MSGINRAALILSIFAALWAGVALAFVHAPNAFLVAPFVVSAALICWRIKILPDSARGPEMQRHVRRVVLIWSGIEILVLIVVLNLLRSRPEFLTSVAAIVIGLHFLPMAFQLPQKIYWVTGFALAFIGLASLLTPMDLRPIIVAAPSAVILWLTAILIREPLEAATSSTSSTSVR